MSRAYPLVRRKRDTARRQLIIRVYLGGASVAEVAHRFGIKPQSLSVNLHRWGVRLPDDERQRRVTESNRRAVANGKGVTWPDCPDHLRPDYETLRKYMPAREARAALEGTA